METITKKTKIAKEYTVKYFPLGWGGKKSSYSKWDESKGQDMVEKRIKAALAKIEMPTTVRESINFNVKLVEGAYDMKNSLARKFTRVYVGSGWRRGDRQMFVSKSNQSIDIATVVAAIVERAKRDRKGDLADDVRRDRQEESEVVAEAINKDFKLDYSSRVRVDSGSSKNSVRVELSGAFSPSDARRIVKLIKSL